MHQPVEPSFNVAIRDLISQEMDGLDQARMANAIERLAYHTGFMIGILCGGDPKRTDAMIEGVNGYTHSVAVDYGAIGRLVVALAQQEGEVGGHGGS